MVPLDGITCARMVANRHTSSEENVCHDRALQH